MLARLTLALLFVAPAARAETLTVGPDAGAFDHTSLQVAVNAAEEGDTIRVAPGTYDRFTVDGKALTILGAGSDSTFIRVNDTDLGLGIGLGITIRFTGLGTMRVGGFTLLQEGDAQTSERPWIDLDFCDGSVELFDLDLPVALVNDYTSLPAGIGFIDAFRMRQLVLSGCHVRGGAELSAAPALAGPGNGYRGFNLRNSRAWAVDCTFEGSPTGICSNPFVDPLRPGPGVFMDRARLLLSNSRAVGAQGGATTPPTQAVGSGCPPTTAGAGVFSLLSELEIHAGPNTWTAGGYGPADSQGGPGVLLANGILRYPLSPGNSEPVGGQSENGPPGACILSQGSEGIIQGAWPARPTTRAAEYLVPLGGDLVLEHFGSAGQPLLPFFSTTGGVPGAALPVIGDTFLDPLQAVALQPVQLDAEGQGQTVVSVPAAHELLDMSGLLQCAEAREGAFYLSNPLIVAVTP